MIQTSDQMIFAAYGFGKNDLHNREKEGEEGCWMLDTGCWIRDAGYVIRDDGKSVLINGVITRRVSVRCVF